MWSQATLLELVLEQVAAPGADVVAAEIAAGRELTLEEALRAGS